MGKARKVPFRDNTFFHHDLQYYVSGFFYLRVYFVKFDTAIFLPFHSQDLISNSPYYLPYNSYDDSSENLVLSWSHLGVKGLTLENINVILHEIQCR